MGSAAEVVEHVTPGRVIGSTAAMAFVDHNQIEEVGWELAVDLLPLLTASHGLIECQIDFVVLLDLTVGDLVHHFAKGREVLLHGLVDQDVAVRQEENAFLGLCLPQPPDDLEGGVGLASTSSHDQQHALLALGNSFDGAVDGHALIVARLLATAISVERLLDKLDGGGFNKPLPLLVKRPQII